jgi:hypothetical protein
MSHAVSEVLTESLIFSSPLLWSPCFRTVDGDMLGAAIFWISSHSDGDRKFSISISRGVDDSTCDTRRECVLDKYT